MPRLKLLEVGSDFKIEREFTTHGGKYRRRAFIDLKDNTNYISDSELVAFVKTLQERYPDKGYRFTVRKYGDRVFYVIRRGKGYSYKNVPLYYSPSDGKFYVPQSYAVREPRLTSAMLDINLTELGVPLIRRSEKIC